MAWRFRAIHSVEESELSSVLSVVGSEELVSVAVVEIELKLFAIAMFFLASADCMDAARTMARRASLTRTLLMAIILLSVFFLERMVSALGGHRCCLYTSSRFILVTG